MCFLKYNIHTGQVPCLQLDAERRIPESLIVCEYLDHVYPENKLIPSDPYTNAKHKLIIEAFSKVITIFYKVYRGEDSTAAQLLLDALEVFEKNLQSKFFGGYFNFENLVLFNFDTNLELFITN